MCGGDLNVTEDSNVVKCEFCDTTQTVLMPDNEKKTNLYNRANRLRFANEFDKAAGVFESLVAEFPEEAEAYWGLCLCKYGIEYVDDPATGKKIPTCHRTSYESIFDDQNFDLALEYADPVAKSIYREEAKSIDRIQKGILEIASKEEPFDIFICYKETDDKGERTIDSVLAQDIYDKLTEKGYKVFFSRITLEDKLGQEYEPYIFSALNSAKIMLVIGTKYEYFEAVWVKNEWSRFLDLMKNDKDKILIPCYRDIDAYDMPREFKNLQGQDMSKLGYEQDLARGIDKLLNKGDEGKNKTAEDSSSENRPTVNSLLERVKIFLSDGNWESADQYCEKVLDIDPKNAQAYLYKLMSELKLTKQDDIVRVGEKIKNYGDYKKAYDFGDDNFKQMLDTYSNQILYNEAVEIIDNAVKTSDCELAKEKFEKLGNFKDSAEKAGYCDDKINQILYNEAIEIIDNAVKTSDCERAKEIFQKLGNFKDSAEKVEYCNNKIKEIKDRIEKTYNEAVDLYNSGDYKEATFKFCKCENTKDTLKYLTNILKNNISVACGNRHTAGLKSDGTVVASGDNEDGQCNVSDWKDIVSVACGGYHTVGLKSDGKVISTVNNRQYSVSSWKDIVSIASGENHIVGLKSDGTVVAAGDNEDGQCNVSGWRDIVSVACGNRHTVGLKSDGTVVAAGHNEYGSCDVSGWRNIVSVACGRNHTVGLKSDGTVIFTSSDYDSKSALEWKDIVSIAVGRGIVGLKSNGTVIASVYNIKCSVSDWKDIVSVACGTWHTVGLKSDGTVVAAGNNNNVSDWKGIVSVSCGRENTVGLKSDGTVVATGDNVHGKCNVSHWKDIVSIACGEKYTAGLKSDGTVVITSGHDYGQCNVSDWKDVVSIACGYSHTVGLKPNGTVVAAGRNDYGQCDVSGWKDIVSVACGTIHTAGLKSDGTVIATGSNDNGKCNVTGWKDIVSVACGSYYTAGLKSDGTVVAAGDNEYGQCNVTDWKDIVSVACGKYHTVGLKSDGTVITAGDNGCGQCNISNWKDIVSIACENWHTVGLKSDGTVVAVGNNSREQCNVQNWRNIDHFTNVKKFLDMKESFKMAARERISKAKAKIKELEETLRNKNEYKNKLNEQLKEIYKEINKVSSDLENIGLALFGKKAAMKKELQDKLDSLNKNEQDINMKLKENESELSDLQSELADNYGLL